MNLLNKIKENAKIYNQRIILPEGDEERTLKAADIIIEEKIASISLIGNEEKIMLNAADYGLKNLKRAKIINPFDNKKKEAYVELMIDLRKNKGLTREEAEKLIVDPLYLAALMIKAGDADGAVAGARSATGDVLRPAFQYIKTMPGISVVSGAFIMILKDKEFGQNGIMVFADCAVHPNPTDRELAEIAVATAKTTRDIAGIEPIVAMLSFSTKGSAKHELVDKVINATRYAKEIDPCLKIDG